MTTRLLLVAHDVIGERMAGPGIRAWEMASALARRGVHVNLAAPGSPVAPVPQPDVADPLITQADVPAGPADAPAMQPAAPWPRAIARGVDLVGYDAGGAALRAVAAAADVVLVQGLALANHPFLATLAVPLVADLYDPFVLENLAGRAGGPASRRARRDASDRGALVDVLERADYFLCASEVQRDFWVGALATAGRVNAATYDADPTLRSLIDVVPFGIPGAPPQPGAPAFKGRVPGIGADDIVALWGGGIWNWFDPITLIRAAELVSRTKPLRLVFLGTSSPSPHVPEMAAARQARALADELGLTGREVFFNDGWVPYADRGRYLLDADIGVSCHLSSVEARYAFRTRLLDCIWAGLPMVVTEGDVLAEAVAGQGLGEAVPAQDVEALAAALGRVCDRIADPAGRESYAAAFAAVRPEYLWDLAVAPLARFLGAPSRAPDAGADRGPVAAATPVRALPGRAWQVVRDEGVLALADEAIRYLTWRRRPK